MSEQEMLYLRLTCPLLTEISQGDGKSDFARKSTVITIKIILVDFRNMYKNNSHTVSLKCMS